MLEVIYLIFNEGCAATAGDDLVRPGLAREALRLGRILAGLMPDNADVFGLLALMETQASPRRAQRPDGAFIPLTEQNRATLAVRHVRARDTAIPTGAVSRRCTTGYAS